MIADGAFYAAAIPAVILFGIAKGGVGVWLHRRVSDRFFFRFVYTLLFFVGIKLVYDGIRGVLPG